MLLQLRAASKLAHQQNSTGNYCSSIKIKCTSLFLHAAATVSPELFQATDVTPPLNVEVYTL